MGLLPKGLGTCLYAKQSSLRSEANYATVVCKIQFLLSWWAQILELWVQSVFFDKQNSIGVMPISQYPVGLLIFGLPTDWVLHVKQEPFKWFEIVGCGETKICFGLEIARDRNKLSLKICPSSYAVKVFGSFNMEDCKPVPTPMESQINTAALNYDAFCSTKYCQANGSLMYFLVCSRPDTAFSVDRRLQFVEKPSAGLWM